MKHVGRCVLIVGCVALFMLLYVHQQVTILRYSYKINTNEETLANLVDTHKKLKFDLAALKSPTSVEQKLTAADISLVLPHEVKLVKVPVVRTDEQRATSVTADVHEGGILKLLGFDNEAQAQTHRE